MTDGYFTGSETLLLKGTLSFSPRLNRTEESESPTRSDRKTKIKVSKLLSDLTPYCQSKKFKDFQHSNGKAVSYQPLIIFQKIFSIFRCAPSLKPPFLRILTRAVLSHVYWISSGTTTGSSHESILMVSALPRVISIHCPFGWLESSW